MHPFDKQPDWLKQENVGSHAVPTSDSSSFPLYRGDLGQICNVHCPLQDPEQSRALLAVGCKSQLFKGMQQHHEHKCSATENLAVNFVSPAAACVGGSDPGYKYDQMTFYLLGNHRTSSYMVKCMQ